MVKQQILVFLKIFVDKKNVKIYVMLFKNWKHVFKLIYQTSPLLLFYLSEMESLLLIH